MPEWWTAGVGGFARAHPAVLAFGMLIGIAMLVIGFASWERDAGRLAREAREQAPSSLPASVGAPADRSVSAPEPSSNAPFSADAPRTKVNAETSAPATALRMARRDDPPAAMAPTTGPVALEVPPLPAAAIAAPVMPDAPAPRSVGAPSPPLPLATVRVPTADEIEAQFVVFVDTYNGGRLDALSALFDDDAQTNQRQGRAAIRREYDDLFQRSDWRRMKISRMSWKLAGEVAQVRAEGAVRIAWRDGREVEERFALDMDLAWRGGRVFIIRLAQRTSAP